MNNQQLEILVDNLHLISARLLEVQTRPTMLGTQDSIDIGLINKDLLAINKVLIDHLLKQEGES